MTIPYYKELEKRQEGEGTLGYFSIFRFTVMQLRISTFNCGSCQVLILICAV